MNCGSNSNSWYVIHTHARQEDRAERNLNLWGVKTFLPKLKESTPSYPAPDASCASKPLFPGYIFACFDARVMLHNIAFTRGVRDVVRTASVPVSVPEHIIDLVRSRIGRDGYVTLNREDLCAGDELAVTDGPLSRLEGIFERTLKDPERVVLLLKAVNYQSRVIIERHFVRKLK